MAPEHRAHDGFAGCGRIGSDSSVVDSGEVALWRAVLEQALHDACRPSAKPPPDRAAAKISRKRNRIGTAARAWFKDAARDFSVVCDFADLPAKAVQDHAYELIGTPAEKHSRSLRQVEWRAPEKAGVTSR